MKETLENRFLQVQKPARYTGGELHSVTKDLRDVDVRFAFCFPDTYEIGIALEYADLISNNSSKRAIYKE